MKEFNIINYEQIEVMDKIYNVPKSPPLLYIQEIFKGDGNTISNAKVLELAHCILGDTQYNELTERGCTYKTFENIVEYLGIQYFNKGDEG